VLTWLVSIEAVKVALPGFPLTVVTGKLALVSPGATATLEGTDAREALL
jgi:hypothetical protein